ncbi:MAG: hypothetical protein D3910_04840 [Candidatus Electrothrix sp. ATG2]|nr:hypothetical protein [Candidatus Electrothrix sp. ATG2]
MKRLSVTFTIILAASVIILCGFTFPAFAGNLAKGKTVAAWGEFFTGGWGNGLTTDFSTLTDGTFFAKGHQWDQGPIWWDEGQDQEQNFLQVFLGPRCYKVRKIRIQVDNNDDYIISWNDKRAEYASTNPQQVIIVPSRHWGMDRKIVKKINAVTDAFMIEHDSDGAGDGLYSVSEFQAMGWEVTCPQQ